MRIRCRFFSLVLVAVCAASCTKVQVGDPYMLFEVHGTVRDSEGNPIEGIKVSAGLAEVQSTNLNGNFSFYGRSTPSSSVILTFEDKDGDKNGGEFIKRTLDIPVHEKTPGSEIGNFRGTYFASGVEVVMVLKEDDMNPDSGFTPL